MALSGDKGRHRRAVAGGSAGRTLRAHRRRDRAGSRRVRPSGGSSVGRSVAAAVVDRPQYTWQDFELDDERPRAQPEPPDTPHLGRRPAPLRGPREDPAPPVGRQAGAAADRGRTGGGEPGQAARPAEGQARRRPRRHLRRPRRGARPGRHGLSARRAAAVRPGDVGHLRGSVRRPQDRRGGPALAHARRDDARGRARPRRRRLGARGLGVRLAGVRRASTRSATPLLASAFHRQPGGLGRKEFFADAFAAIASRQRPALVDMLGGDTRMALNVMLFFNRRYGI